MFIIIVENLYYYLYMYKYKAMVELLGEKQELFSYIFIMCKKRLLSFNLNLDVIKRKIF